MGLKEEIVAGGDTKAKYSLHGQLTQCLCTLQHTNIPAYLSTATLQNN